MKKAINKITLSGEVASGKSTVGKLIAEKLDYKFESIGNITRKTAESEGLSIVQFQNKCLENPEFDKKIDFNFSEECNASGYLVIDYRMGFHFIKDGFHVFLKISEAEATKRLKNVLRKNETHHTIQERNDSFKNQFLNGYSIDYTDESHYDLIIDVIEYASAEEIADFIIHNYKLRIKS